MITVLNGSRLVFSLFTFRRLGALTLALFCFAGHVAMAAPNDPHEGGQWSSVIDWPHIAVSAANLPDGRILT